MVGRVDDTECVRVTGMRDAIVCILWRLLPDPDQTRPTVENETWPDTFSDLGQTVAAGTGATEHPSGV